MAADLQWLGGNHPFGRDLYPVVFDRCWAINNVNPTSSKTDRCSNTLVERNRSTLQRNS